MKTILITGATGFLGHHLLVGLIEKYNIIILKRSFSDISNIQGILPKIKSYDIDKLNYEKVFHENHIDTIIHTATNYGKSNEFTTDILSANLMLPLGLFELGLTHGVKTFINTDTFYNTDKINYDYLLSYALSKRQFTDWLKLLSSKMQVINLKIGIIYGPKDDMGKFTMQIIRKMINNEDEIALTSGEQKRDFLYVEEAADIYKFILNNVNNIDKGFNEFYIGTGHTISIKKFTKTIHKLLKSKSVLRFGALPYREHEIMEPDADITKLLKMGWKPKISLEEGLGYTIEYAKSII